MSRQRIALLDEIRGFCILCMVFYHSFYLFGTELNLPAGFRLFHFFEPLQILFASAFIFISGICTHFSRNVLRRGGILLLIALLISAVTILLLPRIGYDRFQDKFGILHLLSICMLLSAPLRGFLARVSAKYGALGCIMLYAVSWLLTERITVGIPYLFPLGFRTDSFYSADYFPILPHAFVFFAGVFCGKTILQNPVPDRVCKVHVPLFSWAGRHSLWIYLAHVPILLLIITCLERI